MKHLAKVIRRTAEERGVGLEAFRRQAGIPNTTFYGLLRGETPKKIASMERLKEQLRGVGIPLENLAA